MSVNVAEVQNLIESLLKGKDARPAFTLQEYLKAIPRLDSLSDVKGGTPVLIRGDLDAKPGAQVGEGDIRLRSMVETLEFGLKRGWKQILFGHIGRKPEGSLKAVAKRLGEILKCEVTLIPDWFDETTGTILDSVKSQIDAAPDGAVIVLENTRKYGIERLLWDAKPIDSTLLSDPLSKLANEFAEKVAKIYINEALSAGSLDASSTIVPMAMDRVALGKYVANEFDGPMLDCLRAQLVVFSGLKTDKLDDLQAMIDRGTVKWVFTAGSLAMALKKAAAELDGKSFSLGVAENPANAEKPFYIAPERVEQAKGMMRDGRAKGIEFILPVDFLLQDARSSETIGPEDQQFDVGPKTSEHFAAKVGEFIAWAKKQKEPPVAFFNGVFGMFEDPRFAGGTRAFIEQLKRMTDAGVKVYVGGGEGGAALDQYGKPDWVKHCFTAGGTVLNAMGSAPVPYLQTLKTAAEHKTG